jgi:hypothetical protein
MKEKSRVLTVVFATLELFFHEEGDSVVIHRKHAQPCPKLVRVIHSSTKTEHGHIFLYSLLL